MNTACRGATFIELLLSLSIGFILLGLLLLFAFYFEKQQQVNQVETTLQAQMQIALQTLRRELEQAGYIGCARLSADFPLQLPAGSFFNAENSVERVSTVGGQDRLRLRYQDPKTVSLVEAIKAGLSLKTSAALDLVPGAFVLISDCRQAELFQVKRLERRQGQFYLIAMEPLQGSYQQGARLGVFITHSYWVENHKLYRQENSRQRQVLVDGVERLDFAFLPFNKNSARRALALTLWFHQKERSVKLNLFVSLRV